MEFIGDAVHMGEFSSSCEICWIKVVKLSNFTGSLVI